MAKIDEAEYELLQNLFNFIQKKLKSSSISEIEKKFGDSALKLTSTGDISIETLKAFCEAEGIEMPKKPTVITPPAYRPSESYGCGTSSPSRYRSSC